MTLVQYLHGIMENPTILGVCTATFMFLGPIWLALLIGVVIGWAWKPKWASAGRENLSSFQTKYMEGYTSSPCSDSIKSKSSNSESLVLSKAMGKKPLAPPPAEYDSSSSSSSKHNDLTVEDLQNLFQLVEMKDGGPSWIHMMDRSTPNMSYQAWRRDPKEGPPQYRSRTVFEDATPEMVRDFFWDDDFRSNWDDMLASSTTIEECPTTGTMKVQWIRKFPFFCKDREYIIGRRIWDAGRIYYCVTKGIDCPSIPRREKPRRVDLYYSSWCIRAVESQRDNSQHTACEVVLFHYEDMGIPWEIAKLGVRKGMWGTVQKIEPGLRAYQQARASKEALSRSAYMAQINTKVNPEYLHSLGASDSDDISETETAITPDNKPKRVNVPKFLLVGGAIALACSLDRGLVTKAVIFGVARRLGNIGKR